MSTPPYPKYLEIRNKCCIAFYGPFEFLKELIEILPQLENKFPELEITIACRDEFYPKFNSPKIIPRSQCLRVLYGYFHELTYNMIDNPVKIFLQNCGL